MPLVKLDPADEPQPDPEADARDKRWFEETMKALRQADEVRAAFERATHAAPDLKQ